MVLPYVSSLNSTETFSDLVRRLLTSAIFPTYHALYGGPNHCAMRWPAYQVRRDEDTEEAQACQVQRLTQLCRPALVRGQWQQVEPRDCDRLRRESLLWRAGRGRKRERLTEGVPVCPKKGLKWGHEKS